MPLNNQLGNLGTLGGINDADTGYSSFFDWSGVTGGVTGTSEPKFPTGWYSMTPAGQDDWIRRNPRTAAAWGLHQSTYYDSTVVDAGPGYSQPSGVSGVADYINGTGSGSNSGASEVKPGMSFRAVVGTEYEAASLSSITGSLDPAAVERDLARLLVGTNLFNNIHVSMSGGGFLSSPVFTITGTSKIERAHAQDILDDIVPLVARTWNVNEDGLSVTVGSNISLPAATNTTEVPGTASSLLPSSLTSSGLIVPAVLVLGLLGVIIAVK